MLFSVCFSISNERPIGIRKADEHDLFEERDKRMRGRYVDSIEGFPRKVDQLFEVWQHVSTPQL